MPANRNRIVSFATQIGVCVVLLAVGGGVFLALTMTRPAAPVSQEPSVPRRVAVMDVVAVEVRRQWVGFGTAAATDSAEVSAEVSAVVVDLPQVIVAGREVARGDVLVVLDPADFARQVDIIAQQLEEIRAQLEQLKLEEVSWTQRLELACEETELSRRELRRVEDALQRQAAKPREVDRARLALNILARAETRAREELQKITPRTAQLDARRLGLEAQRHLAEMNLQRCTVRSPLDGVIQAVDVEVGERVTQGERVARVVSLHRIEVPVQLPASARSSVSEGGDVVLTSRGSVANTWYGSIRRIGPEDDRATRTLTVYVDLEQDPRDRNLLAPGRFVQATVISAAGALRTVVPRRSLLDDRILLIQENVVRSHPVRVEFHVTGEFPQLGVTAEQWAVLTEDLPTGSRIVVNAARSLTEGLEVEPVALSDTGLPAATAGLPAGERR